MNDFFTILETHRNATFEISVILFYTIYRTWCVIDKWLDLKHQNTSNIISNQKLIELEKRVDSNIETSVKILSEILKIKKSPYVDKHSGEKYEPMHPTCIAADALEETGTINFNHNSPQGTAGDGTFVRTTTSEHRV